MKCLPSMANWTLDLTVDIYLPLMNGENRKGKIRKLTLENVKCAKRKITESTICKIKIEKRKNGEKKLNAIISKQIQKSNCTRFYKQTKNLKII